MRVVRASPCVPITADPVDDGGFAIFAAMPMPAAIYVEGAGGVALARRNAAFAAVLGDDADATAASGIPRAAAALLAEGEASGPRTFRWHSGDAASGRHFEIHLTRADTLAGRRAVLASLVDRTAEIESARSLRAEMAHDSLTGLPNRAAFIEAVEAAAATGRCHAILLADLSRFARVNESLGAIAGDELLITVARRLLSSLRAGDLLARVGGDEFGILLRVRDGGDAAAAAARIRRVMEVPFRLARFEIGIECALGGADVADDGGSGEECVRHAQLALKRAKASGRVEMHRADGQHHARARLDIETELRRAIADRALRLVYQPIVDLGSDRPVGFEALARWQHPVRGAIAPTEFIPVAEETGLIVPLGRWALDEALATLARWDARAGRALPLSMSVNVSAIQLVRDDVPALVASALARHGIAAPRLRIELTESALVEDPEHSGRALRALKALDVDVAMDDFGTGHSSLTYLRNLPIDILKIDRSFVTGMLADRDKLAIVRAVIGLADALGKRTTAEGIESAEVGQTLAALGCALGQGYHYARPLEADAAWDYCAARVSGIATR